MYPSRVFGVSALVAMTILATACGAVESPPRRRDSLRPPAAAPIDPATAGNINGKIVLEGTAAKNEPIRMNADPVCSSRPERIRQPKRSSSATVDAGQRVRT